MNNRTDCKELNGYKPCRHHKKTKQPCAECGHYRPMGMRILIIKVRAAGEVIRNTPVLYRLRDSYPDAEITWLTSFPDLVPAQFVDRVLLYSWETTVQLTEERFDLLLSLDKESGPAALANKVKAAVKKGFILSDTGKTLPADNDAREKWLTGIDDVRMLANKKHYVQEVFEICGFKWEGEKYILPQWPKKKLIDTDRPVVGINTGAGQMWRTRIPHAEKVEEIIKALLDWGKDIVLLGGPDEDARNSNWKKKYGVHYLGVMPLLEFINVIDNCDAVITPVTMALHIAIGLSKQVVLLNNIFNKYEFHLYGRGTIIEPDLNCLGCYKKDFGLQCPVEDCTKLYNVREIMSFLEAHPFHKG